MEVEPLAANTVMAQLERLGSRGPRLREGQMAKAGPIKTDQDNFIVDAPFRKLLLPKDIKVREKEKVEDGDALVAGAGVGRRVSLGPAAEGAIGVDGGNLDGEGREWEVEALAREIKMIEGVLSVGLFCGLNGEEVLAQGGTIGGQKPVAAYFGMANGDVVVREKGKGERLVEKSKED